MNWLDYFLLLLAILFAAGGLKRGLSREAFGLAATVAGILLAAWFYGVPSAILRPYLSSDWLAHMLGFLLIFFVVQIAGALAGTLLARLLKWTGLGWLDRVGGALFGVVKAGLVGVVLVMILTAFPAKPLPDSVAHSRCGPYLIEASHVLAYLAPRELREGFVNTYERLRQWWQESKPGASPGPPKDSA